MFCALEVVFLSAADGGVAVVGEDAAGVSLAIADDRIDQSIGESIQGLKKCS